MKDEIDVYKKHSAIISKRHKEYKKTAVKTAKGQSSPKTKAQFVPETELEFFYDFLSKLREENYEISEYRFFDKLDDFAKIIKRPLPKGRSPYGDIAKNKYIDIKDLEAAKTTYISQYIRDSKSKYSQKNLTLFLAFVSCYYQDKTEEFYKDKLHSLKEEFYKDNKLHSLKLEFCPLDKKIIENYRQQQEETLKDNTEPDKIETENQKQSDNPSPSNTPPHIPSSSLTDSFNNSEIAQPASPQLLIKKTRDPIRFKRELSIHDPFDDSNVPYEGRQEQFQLLEKFVEDAKDKKNLRIWAISGPSGCGKTRLMREWLITSKNLQGWDQLVLEQKDNDSRKWEDWNPEYNTIFVIDYLYGFMETLKTIMDRCRDVCNTHKNLKIRILILDHVFPQNLQELEKKITSVFGVSNIQSSHRYSDLFFEKTPINLETTDDQDSIIRSVLKHAAGTDVEEAKSQTALAFLQKMEGAWHPLFAVLIGNTFKDSKANGESLDLLKWSRRKLIEHYLAGTDRLPWNSDNTHNIWASAFVAISTARRGMAFETLRYCVPVTEVTLKSINFPDIRSGCEKIISVNRITDDVPPYIPDILGESFFLRFVEDLQVGYSQLNPVEKPFYHMLFCGDDETVEKDAVLFIEFIQRLTRNLCNDAQEEDVVQNHWEALCCFLNPKRLDIPLSSPMAMTVSATLLESTKIIEEQQPEGLAALKERMFGQIDFEALCYPHKDRKVLLKSVEYAMKYYEQVAGSGNNNPALEVDLIKLLQYYEDTQKQRNKGTALIVASYFGCDKVVTLLFEKNLAQIDVAQIEYWTALMSASNYGHTDIVKKLLTKEANPNLQNENGWTALMMASYQGYTEIVEELLAKKANPDLHNKDSDTALIIASYQGHTDIVKELLNKEANPNLRDKDRWTALKLASRYGYTDIVKKLLAHNANSNLKDKYGWTALMAASNYGHLEIVKELLIHNANTDLQNNEDWSALMLASNQGHTDIVKELLAKEANPNLQNKDSETALIFASKQGYTDIVKELLNKEAKPDLQNTDEWTALMMASRYGYIDIVKELLDYNAKSDLQNNEGWTALMMALSQNHSDIIDLLLEKDASLKTGLHYHWHDVMPASIITCKHNEISHSHFNSFALVENADDYPWKPLSQAQTEILKTAKIFFEHENHWAAPCVTTMILPWYQEQVSLIHIRNTGTIQNPLTIYCIEYKNNCFRLTGESTLLHYLRQSASFKLTEDTALDYLRFFCFFVRREDKAFNIIDPDLSHWQENLILPENQSLSAPQITNIDEQGNYECDAVVSHGFCLSQAQFRVYNDGKVDMLDDNSLQEALCRLEDEMLVSSHFIFTPLMAACKTGYKEVVRKLLEEGANITVEDHKGWTALMMALCENHPDIIDLLLEKGACLKAGLHYHWHDVMPASIIPCKQNDISASHFNSFALMENESSFPWNPLSQAQTEILKTAKIFFKHENHWTAPCVETMLLPWYQEQISLIRIRDTGTIQNPLTIYCATYKGDYFRFTGESDLLHYLRQSASFKLTYNTALDYLRFFCFFLRGASVAFNIIDPDLSHWQNNLILPENQFLSSPKITNIDEQGNYECDAVVSYGFYICQAQFCIDNDGNVMPNVTPLEESLCRSEYEMLVSNHFIFTPLMTACKAGFKKVVRQLIEEGVDISVEDHEGKTALSYAQDGGHTEIVDMLLVAEANKKP